MTADDGMTRAFGAQSDSGSGPACSRSNRERCKVPATQGRFSTSENEAGESGKPGPRERGQGESSDGRVSRKLFNNLPLSTAREKIVAASRKINEIGLLL